MRRRVPRIGLACFFLLCTGSATGHWIQSEPPADLQSAEVAPPAATQRLELPSGLPEQFDVVVRIDEATHVLHLVRHSLRAHGFRSHAYLPDGRTIEVTPDSPATYRGWVVDQPLWPVVADLRREGLSARVFFEPGAVLKIRTVPGEDRSTGDALHTVGVEPRRSCSPLLEEELQRGSAVASAAPDTGKGSAALPHDGLYLTEIAFDLTHQFYEANGSTVPDAVAAAEAILNDVDYVFAREALISYTITEVIVRTAPFYPSNGNLSDFRNEWNTNQAHIQRDLAHLLTVYDSPGGIARVGSICEPTVAYSISSDHGPEVMIHELAHIWGAWHCHEYWPCNATCDSCMSLGLKTKDVILAFRDSVTCLDEGGSHAVPLPPYAQPDAFDVTRDELATGAALALDVLANDHDGNLDPLSIEAFDPFSWHGGSLVLSESTGAGGNDELVYTPTSLFPGDDHLHYFVGDGTGFQSRGAAKLRVAAPGLIGYWPLDETTDDLSGGVRDAKRILGAPLWVRAVHAEGLQLDGIDDYVEVPGFDEDIPAVTFAAWIRRQGDQTAFAGLVVGDGLNTEAGLTFGSANELRYHWNADPAASDWDSGLVVPDDQWVLVALAVETQQAAIYLHDGATLQSAVNPIEHAVLDFDQSIFFGRYDTWPSLLFRGLLDDVRIYNHALGPAEIAALHDLGSRAYAPSPPDGGRMLQRTRQLNWSAGLGALTHDVYFGADYAAVRDATTASPEFLGNTPSITAVAPPVLLDDVTYAWRVDEVTAVGTVKGDVWLFKVDSWLMRWPLDETSGSTAGNTGGGLDGTYLGAPQLGDPGAQPELVHSVYLDGLDDSIEIPPLNLHRREVSFTLWVRRDGLQTVDAGLLITRSNSTIAGLNLTAGGGLRFKWNDRGTTLPFSFFGAGNVIPDGEWALVALAISPDKTTVYVGKQGAVGRFDEFVHNGPEEFDGPLYLGQDPIGGLFFRGSLDDFRVHDHALSPAEMAALYAEGIGAGRVPDGANQPGTPLRLERMPEGEEVVLTWAPSCLEADSDYSIYEGAIGDFAGHLPATCSTGGATSSTVIPQPGDRYFLVVPTSANREGSYGRDDAGQSRPSSAAACFVQYIGDCL